MSLDFLGLAGDDVKLADLVGTDLDGTDLDDEQVIEPEPQPVAVPARAVDFAPQQQEAIDKVIAWYQDSDQQVFRLFGYAGTGKTTLARHIVDELGVAAVFAAFTGKAAYVLRSKGCDNARTIHSLIYTPTEKVRKQLDDLKAQLRQLQAPDSLLAGTAVVDAEIEVLERAIAVEEERLKTPDFILNEESELRFAPLLVLDEVSMVGMRIAADLLSFGVKILCLGDPAQLPPVDGAGFFINAAPDHLLTEIHRSALDSPVTRLASSVRLSPPGDRTLGMPGMDGTSGRCNAITRADLATFDQVLVGTNKTRWAAIHLLRQLHGLEGPLPLPGDRIIGLANSVEADTFNGQQFTVLDVADTKPGADRVKVYVEDDAGNQRWLTAWTCAFTGVEGEKYAKREGRGTVAAVTFAQAITCHKSQGSQWDNVLVVDESWIFARAATSEAQQAGDLNPGAAGHIAGQRWLYTAITRAAKRVVVLPSPRGLPS
jgi:exodeoxyribonuclease-5